MAGIMLAIDGSILCESLTYMLNAIPFLITNHH
jgi:hypothetical protein